MKQFIQYESFWLELKSFSILFKWNNIQIIQLQWFDCFVFNFFVLVDEC